MTRAYNTMKQLLRGTVVFLIALISAGQAQDDLSYTTYTSFNQVLEGRNTRYPAITRVSDPGVNGQRAYTGFFFYQCLQFDTTGRYLLGMKVYVQNRAVQPTDRGDIGFIDLKNKFKWTKIGETTAWNWQQGARLQWRPRSDEIVWNDRSDEQYVCRVYNFHTGTRRILPRPIYDLSPDGATALTHDFERMKHRGTDYVGIEDKYKNQYAPSKTGIWKMNMDTGEAKLIMSLARMASIAYPNGIPSSACLYFFREGWNPSGTRFIAFIKDPENGGSRDKAFSMTPNGTDVRYLYSNPSHHSWQDDNYILDFGKHTPPGGGSPLAGYFLFKDDGTGRAKELLWATDSSKFNGHDSYVSGPGGDWIISDTYSIEGFQYLFLYHRPTKLFVPLAKLKSTAGEGIHRVDLHPRLSRDGRIVSIDATHEGLGRQMYIIDISHILDHPPNRRASAP